MFCHKYEWTSADLHRINDALIDYDSKLYHDKFINSIMELENVQNVAIAFGDFINQACERVCKLKKVNQGNKSIGPKWFDTECRLKRAEAVNVGEVASGGTIDIQRALQVCGEYRAMKQRKRMNFVKNNLKEVEQAFNSNRTEMWKILNNLNNKRNHSIGPAPLDILDYFKKLSTPRSRHNLIMSTKMRQRNSLRNMTPEPPQLKMDLPDKYLIRNFTQWKYPVW